MCLKFKLLDQNRYQVQYPLKVGKYKNSLVGNKPMEMGYLFVDINNTDTVNFSFSEAFSSVPNVIVGLMVDNNNIGNVNVYTESVTKTGGTIKTSAPITAKVIVQAVNFEA